MNNCFRTASGLLRSTPLASLRIEADFPDFKTLVDRSSVNMASRSITITSDGLHNTFWRNLEHPLSVGSSIEKIIALIRQAGISTPPKPPPPIITNSTLKIDDSLSQFNKNSSDPLVFKKLICEKIACISPDMMLFTDGSFRNGISAYSMVESLDNKEFKVIHSKRLPDFVGVFVAELYAIKTALNYAARKRIKTIICTDSLSAIKAIKKNTNGAYDDFIHLPVSNNQLMLLWIPSHIGIRGNEMADSAAKDALELCEIHEVPCFPKSLSNPFKNFKRQQNPVANRAKYNKNLSRKQCITLARLRVGKTLFTTQHYYNSGNPTLCNFCNEVLTVSHVLSECPNSRTNLAIEEILDCSTKENFSRIRNCLECHGIRDV